MPNPTSRSEVELLENFKSGGRVSLIASPRGSVLSAEFLGGCIREFSKRKGVSSDCDLVLLQGFRIRGRLELNSLGLEGAPLLGIEFVGCNMPDGITIEYAYLKSFVFRAFDDCGPVDLGDISARGVTIVDELRLVRVRMGTFDRLDFSDSRLKGGVQLIGIEAKSLRYHGVSGVSFARAVVGSHVVLGGGRIESDTAAEGNKQYAFDGE